jgi:hypothetical protein
MARLGELLVASGLLTIEQVEQALRAQVMWGGRLGTNLIELGYIDLDALAKALSRQRKVPAALARHFERADRELQQRLSPDVAERYAAVPLLTIGPQRIIVFASTDPIDKRGLGIIASELDATVAQLVPSVAAELRVMYHLERIYRIPRPTRFLRARGKSIPPFPQFEISALTVDEEVDEPAPLPADTSELPVIRDVAPVPTLELDPEPASEPEPELDDLSSFAELDEEAEWDEDSDTQAEPTGDPTAITGRDRRRYVRTITDAPATESERQTVGRIQIRKLMRTEPDKVIGVRNEPPPQTAVPGTLGEATRAIRRGLDRDKVGELVILTIERYVEGCDAAILLVVRGDVAIGWKGFSHAGPLPEIGVPLDQGGMVPTAIERGVTLRAAADDLHPVDELLFGSLDRAAGDLVIVPVTIVDRVMCAIALATAPDASIGNAEAIAAAAGAAFARLMRHAAR